MAGANEEVEGTLTGAATGAAKGAAIGSFAGPGGAVVGAVAGGVVGAIGGLFGGKSKGRSRRARAKARAAARKRAASLTAITGLQAARARQATVREATRKRASTVAATERAGVKGSGKAGAVGTIFSQLAGELSFESTAQALSERGGVFAQRAAGFENRARGAESQAASIAALTGTVFDVATVFAGSGKKPTNNTAPNVSTPSYSFGTNQQVTSKPSVFN